MQTARDRVAAAAELAAGVQDRQNDLDGRLLLDRVDVDRDAAAVVDAAHAAVGQDRHLDVVAVAGERLVDRVVDDLLDEVVQAARTGRADVHAGPLADRLETFEDLDVPAPYESFGSSRGGRSGDVMKVVAPAVGSGGASTRCRDCGSPPLRCTVRTLRFYLRRTRETGEFARLGTFRERA